MKDLIIDSVKKEELPVCLETIHKAFLINCEKYGFNRENYPSCAAFMTLEELIKEKESGTHIYAAWVDGKIAGCVQLKRQENDTYVFKRFAVLPEYQHLGLGKELIAFCKYKAKLYGGKRIRLLMVYKNESLRKLYSSCGFKLIEKREDDDHPFICGIYEMCL